MDLMKKSDRDRLAAGAAVINDRLKKVRPTPTPAEDEGVRRRRQEQQDREKKWATFSNSIADLGRIATEAATARELRR